MDHWILLTAFLLTITNVFITANEITPTCPSGWSLNSPNCYRLYTNKYSWEDAREICQNEGGFLANVEDREINSYLAGLASESYWIGLNIANSKWASGSLNSSLDRGYWGNGQPANTSRHLCVAADKKGDWYMELCTEVRLAFVCQRKSGLQASFFCSNGKFISSSLVKNGVDNCGDDSDEANNVGGCKYNFPANSAITISSSGYPSNYPDQKTCYYSFFAEVGKRIKIQFDANSFVTEEAIDILQINVGGPREVHENTMLLTELSGTKSAAMTYYSTNNYMVLKFSTDATVSAKGWRFTASSVTDPGDESSLRATNTPQYIMSPGYPKEYWSNMRKAWVITAPTRKVITLTVVELNLDKGDYINVRDCTVAQAPLLKHFEGSARPGEYVTTTRGAIFVYFHSTSLMPTGKFKFSYVIGCDVIIEATHGEFSSPGYPRIYPNSSRCTWLVRLPNNSPHLTVIVDDMLLEDGKDFLKVYRGANTSGVALHTGEGFTGSTVSPEFHNHGGQITLVLDTSATITNRGFHARYSVSCPTWNPSNNSEVSSGNFSDHYAAKFTVRCLTGYYFAYEELKDNTSVSVECLAGGKWNVDVSRLKCTRVYCGSAHEGVTNGFVRSVSGLYYQSGANYSCYPDFFYTSPSEAKCGSNKQWINTPTCSVNNCTEPEVVVNANMTRVSYGTGINAHLYTVEYMCHPGYEMEGIPILFCMINGNWSSTRPSCDKKLKCALKHLNDKYGQEVVNDTRMYVMYKDYIEGEFCRTGYHFNGGRRNFTCQSDQTFGELPECIDVNECDTNKGGCTHYCNNTVGSFYCTCQDGYTVNGTQCVDINECSSPGVNATGPCYNASYCHNNGGSYTCSCPTGHILFSNNTSGMFIHEKETGMKKGDVLRTNHTCVRVSCPHPLNGSTLDNGHILSKKTLFHYEDTVQVHCNVGFKLSGSSSSGASTSMCRSDGQWTLTNLVCQAQICDIDNITGISNLALMHISPSVTQIPYGNSTAYLCQRSALAHRNFTVERFCRYDKSDDSYKMMGPPLICPDVDCGRPDKIGINISDPTTTYGSSFAVDCSSGYRLSGNSSMNDSTVRCDNQGFWDYGDLACDFEKCKDPGRPADGYQIPPDGKKLNYEVGSPVYFGCNKTGFKAGGVDDYAMTCVLQGNSTVGWDKALPECIDVETPVLGCVTRTRRIDKYSMTGLSIPNVTDNVGGVNALTTVNPAWFHGDYLVGMNQAVNYTASDYQGNSMTCTVTLVVKDTLPPMITCPSPLVVTLNSSSDTMYINVTSDLVATATDNAEGSLQVYYNMTEITVTEDDIGKTKTITAWAADSDGNRANCLIDVTTTKGYCSRDAIQAPVNGQIESCSDVTVNNFTGVSCVLKCNSGFSFYNKTEDFTHTHECNNVTVPAFSPMAVPGCIAHSTNATYTIEFEVQYSPPNLTCNTIDKLTPRINAILAGVTTSLTEKCSSAFSSLEKTLVQIKKINPLTPTVDFEVDIMPLGLQAAIYDGCRDEIKNEIEYLGYSLRSTKLDGLENIPDSSGACPSLMSTKHPDAKYHAVYRASGFSCPPGVLLVENRCFQCAPGTFNNNGTGCEECPIGSYQDVGGQGSCKACPMYMSTLYKGSSRLGHCTAQCGPGRVSDTGFPPCRDCGLDKYSNDNFTQCIGCSSTKTYSTRMSNITDCKDKCSLGTYSSNGYERESGCLNCPMNFYQNETGQTSCRECPMDVISNKTMATSLDDCFTYNISTTACSKITCNNGGKCSIYLHKAFCDCPPGYTGSTCDTVINGCTSFPCFNNGECKSNGANYTCQCMTYNVCHMNTWEIGKRIDTLPDIIAKTIAITLGGYTDPEQCRTKCNDLTDCKLVSSVNNGDGTYNCFFLKTLVTPVGGFSSNYQVSFKNCSELSAFSGARCEKDENDCKQVTCGNHGSCQDKVRDFNCLCAARFSGKMCNISAQVCDVSPCSNEGTCVPLIGGMRRKCLCQPGYTGANCQTNIDECNINSTVIPKPVCLYGGNCTHGIDTRTCACPAHYMGDSCETRKNLCTGRTCGGAGKGMCYDDQLNQLPKCICHPGYKLDDDGDECVMIDNCAPNPCKNGATCGNMVNDFKCTCVAGYAGSMCQHDIDDCIPQPCSNGGRCEDKVDGRMCHCTPGYSGTDCEVDDDNCQPSPCDSTGTLNCTDQVNDYMCYCKPGYRGRNCTVNINECHFYPCRHASNCSDNVNNFTCSCPTGWTGHRCDVIGDQCNAGPCQGSESQCITRFNNYYCRCGGGRSGANCDTIQHICNTSDPCVNGGQCRSSQTNEYNCSCPVGYTGKGCELETDFCSPDHFPCMNGGSCMPLANGYRCSCAGLDFTGQRCESRINNCSGVSCPASGQCVDGVNSHQCLCPVSKLGAECQKAVDNSQRDFDMSFMSLPTEDATAVGNGAFRLESTSDFSLSLWVRFLEINGKGTFFTLYTKGTVGGPWINFIEMNENAVKMGSSEIVISSLGRTLNDGKWNLILLTFMSATQQITCRVSNSGAAQAQAVNTAFNRAWIVMGAEFDLATNKAEPGSGFRGKISRVNMWDTVTAESNALALFNSPKQTISSNLILDWSPNYKLRGPVKLDFPSYVSDNSRCPPGRFGDECLSQQEAPKVVSCPRYVVQISKSKRIVAGNWTEAVFSPSSLVPVFNFRPETKFGWGTHIISSYVKDTNNNRATCQFKLYIRRNDCPESLLKKPRNGGLDCTDIDEVTKTCTAKCDAGYTFIRKHPNRITCGPLGVWNENKPNKVMFIGNCGRVKKSNRRRIAFKLKFKLGIPCDSSPKADITNHIKRVLSRINVNFPGIYVEARLKLTYTCVSKTRRKRAITEDIDVNVELLDTPEMVTGGSGNISSSDVLTQAIVQDGNFSNTGSIGIDGSDIQTTTVVLSTLMCDPPTVVAADGTQCVECSAGTYYDNSTSTDTCTACSNGQWQGKTGQSSCMSCNAGQTTLTEGSTNSSDCTISCPAGQFLNGTACLNCSRGFYQPEEGTDFCLACPGSGHTTRDEGTVSNSSCYDACDSGFELDGSGNCVPCGIGHYRSFPEDHVCVSCESVFTTLTINSTSIQDCKVRVCSAGQEVDSANVTEACVDCNYGYYQEMNSPRPDERCTACPVNTWTRNTRANNMSLCEKYCPMGEEVVDGQCQPCGYGSFKNNGVNATRLDTCSNCTNGFITMTTNSSSDAACVIANCVAGQEVNPSNQSLCSNCPYGTYQSRESLPDLQCISCETVIQSSWTNMTMATSSEDCKRYCPPGQEWNGTQCVHCGYTSFKANGNDSNDVRLDMCRTCPNGKLVSATNSSSEADCVWDVCQVGYGHLNNKSCAMCPHGTYQPASSLPNMMCIQCPLNHWTRRMGANSSTECLQYCPDGQELIGSTCMDCGYGRYKSNGPNSNAVRLDSCSTCAGGNITTLTNSTMASECIWVNCTAGNYHDVNRGCSPCNYGSYQSQSSRPKLVCTNCDADKWTDGMQQMSPSECKRYCPAGFELVSSQCLPCDYGYTKNNGDNNNAERLKKCVLCANGNLTSGRNSTDQSQCVVANCSAGQEHSPDRASCVSCDYGQYQEEASKPMLQCTNCTAMKWTTSMRSTTQTDCKTYCLSGSYLVGSSCTMCPRGQYKDNADGKLEPMCKICPLNATTIATGSDHISKCNIANCSAGYYIRPNNTCGPCPRGTYNSQRWQLSCTSCASGYNTQDEGSTSSSQCSLYCGPGQETIDGQCQGCNYAFYKDTGGFSPCIQCPDGKKSLVNGSNHLANCSVVPADIRMYEATITVKQGLDWAPGLAESNSAIFKTKKKEFENRISSLYINVAGTQLVVVTGFKQGSVIVTFTIESLDNVDKAQIYNTLNNAVASGTISSYTVASDGFSISVEGSTGQCQAGEKLSTLTLLCEDCPVGYYQPRAYVAGSPQVTSCTQCANYPSYTTRAIKSTASTSCVSICDVNSNYCNGHGTCSINADNKATCSCTKNYEGEQCQFHKDLSKLGEINTLIAGILGGVFGVILLCLIILGVCVYMKMKKKRKNGKGYKYAPTGPDRYSPDASYDNGAGVLIPGHAVRWPGGSSYGEGEALAHQVYDQQQMMFYEEKDQRPVEWNYDNQQVYENRAFDTTLVPVSSGRGASSKGLGRSRSVSRDRNGERSRSASRSKTQALFTAPQAVWD